MANTVTPRARQLGAELKALRTAAGMTTTLLGQRVGRSHTHISRWENGKLVPSEKDMAALLAVLDVRGNARGRLFELARDAADPNWLGGLQLAAFMEYERTATRVIYVEPLFIPGLLQIAGYTRSIMIGAGNPPGEAEKLVTLRMGRRDVLTRRNPVEFYGIIGEHALRYPPCERSVMVDQLRHLMQMAGRRNVRIRVLPLDSGYTPALSGGFVVMEFETTGPVLHLEHYRASATLTDAKDVRYHQAAVDTIGHAAMSEEVSVDLIEQLADQMEREI